jgi:hypothetical protein
MTMPEYIAQTSGYSLTAWQLEFCRNVEIAVNENKRLDCCLGRCNGRTMLKNMINEFYGKQVIR